MMAKATFKSSNKLQNLSEKNYQTVLLNFFLNYHREREKESEIEGEGEEREREERGREKDKEENER